LALQLIHDIFDAPSAYSTRDPNDYKAGVTGANAPDEQVSDRPGKARLGKIEFKLMNNNRAEKLISVCVS
jgi:hypothetical protein